MTGIIVLAVLALLLIIILVAMKKEAYAFVKVDDGGSYVTLGGLGSQPLFDADIVRRCNEGWYMYTDDPSLNAVCSRIPPSALRSCSCGAPGIYGRPMHMSYTAPGNISCPGCDMNNAMNLS